MSYSINDTRTFFPPGSVIAYLGSGDPDGWVIADGSNRPNSSIYDRLIDLGIGTRSGSNYTPPNYKGAFLRGIGTSNVSTSYSGPTNVNTSQTDDNKSHNHTITDNGHAHGIGGSVNTSGNVDERTMNEAKPSPFLTGYTNYKTTGISINNSGSTETRPFNIGVNWIIKL